MNSISISLVIKDCVDLLMCLLVTHSYISLKKFLTKAASSWILEVDKISRQNLGARGWGVNVRGDG